MLLKLKLGRFSDLIRHPFDSDQAADHYRKKFLESFNRPAEAVDEFDILASKVVHRWDEASVKVRQAYSQFAKLVVKLTARAVNCARFREAALALYSLFRTPGEKEEVNRRIIDNKSELQKLLAHNVSIPKLQTLADTAQTLYSLQQDNSGQEFGANLVFHQPARFLVDASFEDGDLWGESTNVKPDEELDENDMPLVFPGEPSRFKLPAHVAKGLFAHQRQGLEWLWTLYQLQSGGILADEMGVGKTRQIATFVLGLFESDVCHKILLVCPKTLFSQWVTEFSLWNLPTNKYHQATKNKELEDFKKQAKGILLTSYNMFSLDVDVLSNIKFDYCVLDEGQAIKGSKTRIYRNIKKITSSNRIILSGTPLQNHLKELWTLFSFCAPDVFKNLKSFQESFEKPILRGTDKYASEEEMVQCEQAKKKLDVVMGPHYLRRTTEQVFTENEIPSKTEMVIWLKPSKFQRELYTSCLGSQAFTAARSSAPLAVITLLRKLCDDPSLLKVVEKRKKTSGSKEEKEETHSEDEKKGKKKKKGTGKRDAAVLTMQMANLASDHKNRNCKSSKILFIKHLVDDMINNNHHVIIFSEWVGMLNLIEKSLKDRHHNCHKVDGGTSLPERDKAIKEFQEGKYQVILLTTGVGGVGLTLTRADRVIVVNPAWNPSADNQSVGRAYRFGQDKHVIVYRLITCGTVEENVYKTQVFKGTMIRTVTEMDRQYQYFSKKEKQDCFSLGNFDHSSAMLQLNKEHPWKPDAGLQRHLDYLMSSHDVAGISNHSKLFTRKAPPPPLPVDRSWHEDYIREDEQIQNAQQVIIRNKPSPSWFKELSGADEEIIENAQQVIIRNKPSPVLIKDAKKIKIPRNQAGVIIGRGGRTITHIESQSGAKIQVTRDVDQDPSSSKTEVELTGSAECIAKAEHLINDLLAKVILSNKKFSPKPEDATTSSSQMHTDNSSWDQGRDPFLQQPVLLEKPESTPKVNKREKIWHCKDPSGKIQGPLSMVQLHKWNKYGGQAGSQTSPSGNEVAPQNIEQTPQLVQSVSGQNPQGWSGGPPQNLQPNLVMNMAGQQVAYNQWGGVPNQAHPHAGAYPAQYAQASYYGNPGAAAAPGYAQPPAYAPAYSGNPTSGYGVPPTSQTGPSGNEVAPQNIEQSIQGWSGGPPQNLQPNLVAYNQWGGVPNQAHPGAYPPQYAQASYSYTGAAAAAGYAQPPAYAPAYSGNPTSGYGVPPTSQPGYGTLLYGNSCYGPPANQNHPGAAVAQTGYAPHAYATAAGYAQPPAYGGSYGGGFWTNI